MGKNSFEKIKEMLKELEPGKISRSSLKREIMMNIGCDERTIQKCFRVMLDTRLIEDIDAGQFQIKEIR